VRRLRGEEGITLGELEPVAGGGCVVHRMNGTPRWHTFSKALAFDRRWFSQLRRLRPRAEDVFGVRQECFALKREKCRCARSSFINPCDGLAKLTRLADSSWPEFGRVVILSVLPTELNGVQKAVAAYCAFLPLNWPRT
jgi:hypothetical protein